MSSLTDQEIHALIEQAVEARTGSVPAPAPRRVPIYHAETGEPPPTADGLVWLVDRAEWCRVGYVGKRSEVKGREPKPESEPKPKRGRPPKVAPKAAEPKAASP